MGLCLSSKQHLKPTVHAHLNRYVGPYIEDLLLSFDRGIRFCAVYNKRETEYNLWYLVFSTCKMHLSPPVAYAVVCSKAVVLLLLTFCLL